MFQPNECISFRKVSGTPKKADSPAKAKRKEYLASLKALNTQVVLRLLDKSNTGKFFNCNHYQIR